MTNVNDLVRDHVTLTVECLDRIISTLTFRRCKCLVNG